MRVMNDKAVVGIISLTKCAFICQDLPGLCEGSEQGLLPQLHSSTSPVIHTQWCCQ